MLVTPFLKAATTPTEKRGFVTFKFWGWCACIPSWFWAGWGERQRRPHDFERVTNIPSTRCQSYGKRWVPLVLLKESDHDHSHARKGPIPPFTGAPSAVIETARLPHVLGAFNALHLASAYLEKGNIAAARRKAVLALASLKELVGGAA